MEGGDVHVGIGLVSPLDRLADATHAFGGLVEFFGNGERLFPFEFSETFAIDVGAVGFEGARLNVLVGVFALNSSGVMLEVDQQLTAHVVQFV